MMETLNENYYIINQETQKLELHFKKEIYQELDENLKKEINSNFLFFHYCSGWVSRCKFPNLWRAEAVAKKLGLENRGKQGEILTFEEQMQVKADKAEHRAERYDNKASKAAETGRQLQKPINDMHGDISFFTQPNISSAGGRAFTNRRNKMFTSYEKGFEEFKKSEYYAERAEIARQTASIATAPTDKGFCDRRIKDAEKTIRAQKKNIEHYNGYIAKMDAGEAVTRYNGEQIELEEVKNWIENAEQIIENAISKSIYYHQCIENLGGVNFNKDNIRPGFIVKIARWGNCEVLSTGKVNFIYKVLSINDTITLKAAYSEIDEIVKAEEKTEEAHNGAVFETGKNYNVLDGWSDKPRGTIEILKRSAKFVTYFDGVYNREKRQKVEFDNNGNEKLFCHWQGVNALQIAE